MSDSRPATRHPISPPAKCAFGLLYGGQMRIRQVAQSCKRKAAPPTAVGRAMAEFRRPRRPGDEPASSSPSFAQALEMVFARAREEGEVTDQVDPAEMAQIVEALYVESLREWSQGRLRHLNAALQRRTAIVLTGLRPGAAFQS